MPHCPRTYLRDIQVYGNRALGYVAGMAFEDYEIDSKTKDAVERNLFIVGEAVAQLRNAFPNIAERLSSIHGIVSFRNILAHGYSTVDDAIVWSILSDWLPKLVEDSARADSEI